MGSRAFNQLMDDLKALHERKNADYTSPGAGPFENFERSAIIQAWFHRDIDKVFAGHIGNKLARLGALMGTGNRGGMFSEPIDRKPRNEPIEDSLKDLTAFCGLWYAYYKHDSTVMKDEYVGASIQPVSEWVTKDTFPELEKKLDELTPEDKKFGEIRMSIEHMKDEELREVLQKVREIQTRKS